jgi:tRNA(Ile)-lysidine synthase
VLLARVRRTLRERRLVGPGDRVLVAVSGGPDSVAMLDVLARLSVPLRLTLEVATVDHGLRASAGLEVELVRAHAERLALPFHACRVDVAIAGASVQARARAARYEALLGLAASRGASKISVGHTRDDQAETVLQRLLRGSGPRGLAGIEPAREDGVFRPLLDASRAQVDAWVKGHGLPCVQDPSNADPKHQRARVRHGLLPALQQENPAIVAHLARLADDLRALTRDADAEAAAVLVGAAAGPFLDSGSIRGAAPAVRVAALRAWGEAVTGASLGRAHVEALERALRGHGAAWLPRGWRVRPVPGGLAAERAGP